MGIRRVPASYGVDIEAARFPFFGREDEGTLVTPTLILGTTGLGAGASSPAATSRSEVGTSNKAVAFLNDKSDQTAGSVIPNSWQNRSIWCVPKYPGTTVLSIDLAFETVSLSMLPA